jgi:hypothetical protein
MPNLPPGFIPLPGPLPISPLYDTDKLKGNQLEDKVDVLQDWIEGWVFDCARALLDHPEVHGHFASISLTLSYFEGHQVWRTGDDSTGKSKAFFRDCFKTVFVPVQLNANPQTPNPTPPTMEKVADRLYELARCGFAHMGLPREGVVWTSTGTAITYSFDPQSGKILTLIIDPWKFLEAARTHFDKYIEELKDPKNTTLRVNFEKAWNLVVTGNPIILPPGFKFPTPEEMPTPVKDSRWKAIWKLLWNKD